MVKKLAKSYFSLSRNQRKGILVWFIIMISLLTINIGLPYIIQPPKIAYAQALEVYDSIINHAPANKEKFQQNRADTLIYSKQEFNPNTASDSVFLQIGLSSKQISNIRNYLAKGGQFKVKSDFKKIYSIPESLYLTLFHQIQLPDSFPKKEFNSPSQPPKISTINNLNTTDTANLITTLKINPTLAGRIIKYRNLLGGYHSFSQLNEVYGLNQYHIQKLQDNFTCNTLSIIKFELDTASFRTLIKHPYIGKDKASAISKLKQNAKPITKDILIINNIFTEQEFEKIAPYLIFKQL